MGPTKVSAPITRASSSYLQDGADLTLNSDQPRKIVATKIKDITSHDLLGFLSNAKVNTAAAVAMITKRLFRVSAHAIVGNHGTFVNAINRDTGAIEAKLRVVVRRAMPMKVSLRQIQVHRDDAMKSVVLWSKSEFDPRAMLDHMNSVWIPQANISIALGKMDPVLITTLAHRGRTGRAESIRLTPWH
jgi:hypothetical protein